MKVICNMPFWSCPPNPEFVSQEAIMSLAAAYNPQFSADGKTAAFTGCHHVSPPPGKWTQCEYHTAASLPQAISCEAR